MGHIGSITDLGLNLSQNLADYMTMKQQESIYYIGRFSKLWDEECIALSFESLGLKVIRREEGLFTNKQYIKEIAKLKPKFVIFAKLNTKEDNNKLVAGIKKLGIPTVCWIFDLYFGYKREYLVDHDGYFTADYVFTTDGGHDKEFKEKGINHITLRQGIFEQQAGIYPSSPKYDVVFVGSVNPNYPYRQEMLKSLSKYQLAWFGKNNSDEVRGFELNKLFSEAKIVIGDSVESPNYWSNRIYESLGRGAFLIHPEIPGLEKEFEYYKHFIPYKNGDLKGLRDKIDYFLENPEEREKIRMAGFEFTRANYTYKKRCQTLLEHLNIGTSEQQTT